MIKGVLKKKSFIIMMLAYGILNAGFSAYIAVLNNVFLKYFPDVRIAKTNNVLLWREFE